MASAEARVAHVWRRLGFGPAPGDVEAGVTAGGASAVVEQLLSRPPTTAADWNWPAEDGTWEDNTRFVSRAFELWSESARPVQDRVTWILMGLLVVAPNDFVQFRELKEHQNRLRAWQSAPSYKALLSDVARSGPMQKYLSGIFSMPPHPNENLAREIMELFSIGVTNPRTGATNYTENDVVEISRALTGYLMDWNTGAVWFEQQYWDSGNKTFLGAARGAAKLPDVVNALVGHNSWRYYVPARVYRDLTGLTPSNATLDELANAWGTDGNLIALVAHIARRPEFVADATIGNRVKSPVELLVSALRALGIKDADQFSLQWVSSMLRQNPFAAPDVAGWDNRWLHPTHLVLWSNVSYWMCWHDDGTENIPVDQRNLAVRKLATEATSATATDMALRLAGLYDVSSQTRSAVSSYASTGPWNWWRACGTMQLVLDSPEFLVS
ncbi:MAG: DUF1800 family protein [Acidimicrobiales bacterium]|nr:DUF1800 family protein [Acidimicrobiales bacterium]